MTLTLSQQAQTVMCLELADIIYIKLPSRGNFVKSSHWRVMWRRGYFLRLGPAFVGYLIHNINKPIKSLPAFRENERKHEPGSGIVDEHRC